MTAFHSLCTKIYSQVASIQSNRIRILNSEFLRSNSCRLPNWLLQVPSLSCIAHSSTEQISVNDYCTLIWNICVEAPYQYREPNSTRILLTSSQLDPLCNLILENIPVLKSLQLIHEFWSVIYETGYTNCIRGEGSHSLRQCHRSLSLLISCC